MAELGLKPSGKMLRKVFLKNLLVKINTETTKKGGVWGRNSKNHQSQFVKVKMKSVSWDNLYLF